VPRPPGGDIFADRFERIDGAAAAVEPDSDDSSWPRPVLGADEEALGPKGDGPVNGVAHPGAAHAHGNDLQAAKLDAIEPKQIIGDVKPPPVRRDHHALRTLQDARGDDALRGATAGSAAIDGA